MTPDTFFDNFELLTEAPNAVAKLRDIVLQLAVSGRLTDSKPSDEPASLLLKKVDQEKGIFTSSIQVKKDEQPFPLPPSWEWAYFERVLHRIHYGYTASADFDIKDVRLLRITDIQDNKVNWSSVPGCRINKDDLGKYLLSEGDLLIARTGGTIGKSYLIGSLQVAAVFASYLIRAIPCSQVSPGYLKLFLESQLYWRQLYQKSMGTGQPNVNATSLKSLVVPIPPLAEQKRIVEKCDRLLVLCDAIEKRQKQRQASLLKMNEGAISQLLTAQTPDDFQHHWQGICNNFDLLYSIPETIPKLRQAILQLAVQGKLVPQNPNDEPVDALLETIRYERRARWETEHLEKLKSRGKIPKGNDWRKNYRATKLVQQTNLPSLPRNWCWVSPDEIACDLPSSLTIGPFGSNLIREDYTDEGVPLVFVREIRAKCFGDQNTKFISPAKAQELSSHTVRGGDLLITKMGDPPGDTAIYPKELPPAIITADCIKLTPEEKLATVEYLQYSIRSDYVKYQMLEITKGVAHQKVSLERFRVIGIPLPPLAEQKRIVAKVDSLLSLCDTLEAKLKAVRDSSTTLMEVAAKQILVA